MLQNFVSGGVAVVGCVLARNRGSSILLLNPYRSLASRTPEKRCCIQTLRVVLVIGPKGPSDGSLEQWCHFLLRREYHMRRSEMRLIAWLASIN